MDPRALSATALSALVMGCGMSAGGSASHAAAAGDATTGGIAEAGAGAGDPATSDGGAWSLGDAAVGASGDGAVTVACHAAGLPAGDSDFTMQHAGKSRRYRVYVPPGVGAGENLPLVINLHPLVLDGPGQESFSNMKPAADAHRVIVAYPSGLNGSWNAGVCCSPSNTNNEDDVGFIRAMIAEIEGKACVDARRVYATGHSNGAYLSYRLACEASDVIVAVAPASGTLGIAESACTPVRAVPVLHFHGTADTLVPYDGGNGESVPATIAFWGAHDGCTDAPAQVYAKGAVRCEERSHCAAGAKVVLCTADGGGHCWPGSAFCPVGAPITDIDGDDYMLSFFEQFRMP